MGDNSFNGIGAEPLVVEFFCQVSCSDVLRAKPHFVTNIVCWGFALVNIVEPGHVIGCLNQCSLCLVDCLGHLGHDGIQGFELGLMNGFKSESQILASIKHE